MQMVDETKTSNSCLQEWRKTKDKIQELIQKAKVISLRLCFIVQMQPRSVETKDTPYVIYSSIYILIRLVIQA